MNRLKSLARISLVTLLVGGLTAPAWAGGSVHIGAGYGRHYGGHHYGYGYRGHYHGHGDAGAALLAGLLFGGLVGYAINEDRYYDRAPARYYQAPAYTYYERPVTVVPQPTASAPAFAEPSGCLQTREYTTVLKVDGVDKEAYGTRCLKADGTWVFGPPKIAPQF